MTCFGSFVSEQLLCKTLCGDLSCPCAVKYLCSSGRLDWIVMFVIREQDKDSNKTPLGEQQQIRLQLKRGLFWYRNYPTLHEISKYRSSRADLWTNLRQNSLRVLFLWKNKEKYKIVQKNTKLLFFVKKSLRSYMPHTKVGQNTKIDNIYLKLISLMIYN